MLELLELVGGCWDTASDPEKRKGGLFNKELMSVYCVLNTIFMTPNFSGKKIILE